jgi:hypothetical protein
MDEKGNTIVKRCKQLQAIRLPNEQPWRDVFEYSLPSRVDGFQGEVRDANQTQDRLARLTDSTLAESAQILTSNIQAGMTPANAIWLGFDAYHESQEETQWFERCAEVIWQHIHASNFDAEDYEATQELVLAGWGVLFIDEDREVGGYSFQWWPISGCFVAQSRSGGPVDTIYRPYKLTAEQATNQFKRRGDELSDAVKRTMEKNPDEKLEFVHAIYPRKGYDGGVLARNMPFASCHVEMKTSKLVRESGYHEQPFVCPRWSVLPNLPYGLGPASIALPDARSLNELKRLELQNLDMAVAGMWIAEDDGVLNPRTIKVGARKIIIANSVDSMKALQPATNFNVAVMSEERLEQKIKRVMMADHLTPKTSGPVETAAAVYERIALIRQLMGPLYGRLQSEKLKTLVERCFGLALRAGALPPMPDSLRGKVASVSYRSPFARAQKMEEVNAIERAWMAAGQIFSLQQDPAIFDPLDADESIKSVTKAVGADKILRDPKAIALMRKQRSDAQQAAQQQAAAAPIVEEAGKAMAQNMVNA